MGRKIKEAAQSSRPRISRRARGVFMETLEELAAKDEKIILIVGDVGFHYMDTFKQKYPKQFFNVGVTEQSMMVIAAGLALSGFKPYVFSMVNFVTMRPYEQVRNAICYHNANVKLVGARGREHYNFLGHSHNIYKDEDVKILKGLPNMKIYTPKNPDEVRRTVLKTYKVKSPTYIRI